MRRRVTRIGLSSLLAMGLLVMAQAFAHNSSLTYYRIESVKGEWTMTVTLAQSSVVSSVSRQVGETQWQEADTDTRSQWLARYVVDTTTLTVDGQRLALADANVQMGDHETRVRFRITNWPTQSRVLEVHIPGFSQHPNHHNVVFWTTQQGTMKAVLSARTDHRGVLERDQG